MTSTSNTVATVVTAATTALTAWQAGEALRLARKYGHAWANLREVPDETLVGWLVTGDTAAISAATCEEYAGQVAGIDYPTITVDGDGDTVVRHTTGSGRLVWEVHRGMVIFEIYRPGDVLVLWAINGEDPEDGVAWRLSGLSGHEGAVALPRHLLALEEAVGARCDDPDVLAHVVKAAILDLRELYDKIWRAERQIEEAHERASWTEAWLDERVGQAGQAGQAS